MDQKNIIISDADFKAVMAKIDPLMAKGSGNVAQEELAEIRKLALAVQVYEQKKYAFNLGTQT